MYPSINLAGLLELDELSSAIKRWIYL